MAKKVFVSYKYADSNVHSLNGSFFTYTPTTVRDYVTKFQNRLQNTGIMIYKGEKDGEDLSYLSENTIWEKLKDRIHDSSVTVVFISPNMRTPCVLDRNQWIPWEIAFSLREQPRNDRISRSNALLFVILPDKNNSYHYYNYMTHFDIVKANIDNGYAPVVKWETFMGNIAFYIDKAERQKQETPTNKIVKSV